MDSKERLKQLVTPYVKKEAAKFSAAIGTEEVVQGPAEGRVLIEKTYADGTKEVVLDEKNLVVTQAESAMVQFSLGLRTMSYIELGDHPTPSAPDLADIALAQTTGERKAISGNTNGNMAEYTAEWTMGEGNGFSYTEAGLFT